MKATLAVMLDEGQVKDQVEIRRRHWREMSRRVPLFTADSYNTEILRHLDDHPEEALIARINAWVLAEIENDIDAAQAAGVPA